MLARFVVRSVYTEVILVIAITANMMQTKMVLINVSFITKETGAIVLLPGFTTEQGCTFTTHMIFMLIILMITNHPLKNPENQKPLLNYHLPILIILPFNLPSPLPIL